MPLFDPTVPVTDSDLESKPVRDSINGTGTLNSGNATPPTVLGVPHYDSTDGGNHKLRVYNGTTFVTLFENVNSSPTVPSALSKQEFTMTLGASTYNLVHNRGTRALIVQVRDSTDRVAIPTITHIDDNTTRIDFGAVTTGDHKAVIIG